MSWTPTTVVLGDLPLKAGEQKAFPVNLPVKGATPTQLLVYTFISLEDSAESLHRGFYSIFTQNKEGKQFPFYMNVAMTKDTVINSDNNWLPYGSDFQPFVYIKLNGAEGAEVKPKKKVKSCEGKDGATAMKEYSCQCPDDDEVVVGQAFIIGYQ